jgi:alkenylglycerophosphocholine hydrolase
MINVWLVLALLCIGTDWAALRNGWSKIKYVTKPLALTFLIIWFGSSFNASRLMVWFGLGLFFALIGDILLLFSYRYFILGLAAFLLTHVSYLIGLTCCLPPVSRQFWFLLGGVVCLWGQILFALEKHLIKNRTHRKMVVPVGLYATVLNAMLLFALWTLFRSDWPPLAAALTASGGLLFAASDLLLAVDRFVRPFQDARLWVRITYHLGQLALSAGVALAASGNLNHF